MKRVMISLSALAGLLALSTAAISHPHEAEPETKLERIWPYFGQKYDSSKTTQPQKNAAKNNIDDEALQSKSKMKAEDFGNRLEKRFQRHADELSQKLERAESKNKFLKDDNTIENVEDIREAARAVEELISESGIISGLADFMVEIVDDFDIESSDEGLALNFEGKRLGRLKIDQDKDESIALEGFGRNLSIDKKVIRKNGKTKTRIIIEVDGDEEFDVDITPKP